MTPISERSRSPTTQGCSTSVPSGNFVFRTVKTCVSCVPFFRTRLPARIS
jgi:hypothetical protein